MNAGVLVKICKLESSLNDTQGISKERTENSGRRWS